MKRDFIPEAQRAQSRREEIYFKFFLEKASVFALPVRNRNKKLSVYLTPVSFLVILASVTV